MGNAAFYKILKSYAKVSNFSVPLRPGAGFGGRWRADPAVGGYRSFSGKEIRLIFKNSKKKFTKEMELLF